MKIPFSFEYIFPPRINRVFIKKNLVHVCIAKIFFDNLNIFGCFCESIVMNGMVTLNEACVESSEDIV